ncbi:MAG TPA: glycosyltransferase family 4 protein [Lacipirellulaceae bacterium]|jgi:glycosyltransferase involved in cell wall biosynthesis|nr:glycosyltransferase family 4 protein [Lacipirellulaceae bacterium]
MHIGVILSIKNGLEHFVYRELSELANAGATISLFPCKHRRGLYNPRPEWKYYPWRIRTVLLCQPLRFASMPVRYVSVLWEAIKRRAIVDFLLAAHFAPYMRSVDVLYSTFGDRKLFIGYFAKRLIDKPLSVTIHSSEMYFNPNVELFKTALAACDQIVSVTEHNRQQLADRYGVDLGRVKVVRLSVDLEHYKPAEKFVILIVAFFGPTKGHEILFRAVKELGYDDVEVWVVGGHDGREPINVPAIAKALGVESQVAFFGKLSGAALAAVYHACDVFCLPCHRDSQGGCEGFPAVLIEAMAYGKPVVTTRHTEIPRVVDKIVVKENDVPELVEGLQKVYRSVALRKELGLRSREVAEEHFSNRNVEDRLKLFEAIAKNDGSRPSLEPAEGTELPLAPSELESIARVPQEQLT